MKHYITLDKVAQSQKPTGSQIGAISKRLVEQVQIDPKTLSVYCVQPYGYTWCPAIFNDSRKNANFKSQSVLALDFDSGITPEEVFDQLSIYGIEPTIIYSTFSDSPEHRKFRVVFFLDTTITDVKVAKWFNTNLINLFKGQADAATKDNARLFFGGQELLHFDDRLVSSQALLDVLNTVQVAKDKGDTRRIMGGQKLRENLSVYINNIEKQGFSEKTEFNDGAKIQRFDWDKAQSEVQILNDLFNGEWLYHNQIFGLATNLIHIEGGLKRMKEAMNKNLNYTANNYAALTYVNKVKYYPMNLQNFSPYESDHIHTNVIQSAHNLVGDVKVIKQSEDPMSLGAAEIKMEEQYNSIMNSNNTDIHIIKYPTGIGKTRLVEETNATIAAPTNALKDEIYNRLNVSALTTPELPDLEDEQLVNKIKDLYQKGLLDYANTVLRSVAKDREHVDNAKVNQYLNKLDRCYKSERTVITTHTRALYSKFNNHTLIFDEDPLQNVLSVKSIDTKDLNDLIAGPLRNSFEIKDTIIALRNTIENTGLGQIAEMPQLDLDLKKMRENTVDSDVSNDVISFLEADYYIKDSANYTKVHYISRKDLPENKKVVIMSATVPVDIYKELYGDRVKVYQVDNVESKGSLIQHTGRSFSRASMSKLKKAQMDKMVNQSLPTITFAAYKNLFDNPVEDIHFGNLSGYDSLKGQDINIVGTYHLNNAVYLLYAKALGIKVKPSGQIMEMRTVERNGLRFRFNTYNSEKLQKIQMSLIESELLQAIGRARLLREDCSVHLYSNLPIKGATYTK